VAVTQETQTQAQGAEPVPEPRHRRHVLRWVLVGVAVVILAGGGVMTYLWFHSGAHALPTSVAIERFRQGGTSTADPAGTPAPGVYSYVGSGTERISVPPKSQTEGPGIPGTVVNRPGGCFELRLDYSTAHWQSWTYCPHGGSLVSPTRAGYYNWDFVAFHVDDTSTFACDPAITTVSARIVPGTASTVDCTGSNDKLSIPPVHMLGTSTQVRTADVKVGKATYPAVLVTEHVTFSGGQTGFNDSNTWFSVATGFPLRGTWHTNVSTDSPVGTSTLDAHGNFALTSLTPRR
jgi:hypothetical protein